jgi:hypothetical protein
VAIKVALQFSSTKAKSAPQYCFENAFHGDILQLWQRNFLYTSFEGMFIDVAFPLKAEQESYDALHANKKKQ